ncbi:MAG: Ubiquinone/menaquinone biosynthesis C-methylase UbiE [Pelagibacterales bacterium]|nr:Ubiquinone/menaquinone biosynthesis C-methylase UbiE [Pelagibacterales bacterium]
MINRTSIKQINKILNQNHNWKVLDIGCGFRAHPRASVIADVQDFTNQYKDKKFIKINDKHLPFKDKEFDFVISSHVIEHVDDFEFFIKELERIASKGYIELPSRFGDNLVFENTDDHIWWFLFDDIKKELVASKKNQLVEPFFTVSTAKKFEEIFRESLVIELVWENKIDYIINKDIRNENIKKTTFFKLVRKYLSKKLRMIFK